MVYKYTVKVDKDIAAIGVGRDMPISTKQAIEICVELRGKSVDKAKTHLENVIAMRESVAMRRFNRDVGHKKGKGPGRYPVKACTEILALIKSVESNAQYKGIAGELVIATIVPHRGAGQWHYGRKRRRKMKRSTVEVVLKEIAPKKADPAKDVPKAEPVKKVEPKKEAPKQEPVREEPKKEPVKEISKAEPKKEPIKETPDVEPKKEEPVPKEAPKPEVKPEPVKEAVKAAPEPVKEIPKEEPKPVQTEAPKPSPKQEPAEKPEQTALRLEKPKEKKE